MKYFYIFLSLIALHCYFTNDSLGLYKTTVLITPKCQELNNLLYQVQRKEYMCYQSTKVSQSLIKSINKSCGYHPESITVGFKIGTLIGLRLNEEKVCQEFK